MPYIDALVRQMEQYRQLQDSAAASPPAAEQEEGRADSPPSGPPAPSSPRLSRCKRCAVQHDRMGDLCAGCVADDLDINTAHGAYREMRLLLGYVDLLNDYPEGRVRWALVTNGIHDTLVYGQKLAGQVA